MTKMYTVKSEDMMGQAIKNNFKIICELMDSGFRIA